MMTAVVLAHGVPPPRAILEAAVRSASYFVCADGGANTALAHGLTPHAIVGDFDSVTPETLAAFSAVRLLRNVDTERTDTEKAVRHALSQGPFDELILLGATSDRLDHVIGHLSLLRACAGKTRIVLEDGRGRGWIASGTETLDLPVGTVVSFFAIGAPADGVTTENLRYALTDSRLELGVQDSISNVVTARPARVRIGSGALFFFVVTRP